MPWNGFLNAQQCGVAALLLETRLRCVLGLLHSYCRVLRWCSEMSSRHLSRNRQSKKIFCGGWNWLRNFFADWPCLIVSASNLFPPCWGCMFTNRWNWVELSWHSHVEPLGHVVYDFDYWPWKWSSAAVSFLAAATLHYTFFSNPLFQVTSLKVSYLLRQCTPVLNPLWPPMVWCIFSLGLVLLMEYSFRPLCYQKLFLSVWEDSSILGASISVASFASVKIVVEIKFQSVTQYIAIRQWKLLRLCYLVIAPLHSVFTPTRLRFPCTRYELSLGQHRPSPSSFIAVLSV